MKPAIFLDRDGVIIENRPKYVLDWQDVTVFPQALQALALLRQFPLHIVIATNQSAVGRGQLSMSAARQINANLVQVIERAGGRVDAVFMCPHTPEDQCDCRKPKPGLLLQAAQSLSIDLPGSVMIGDALTDLQAARSAGIHNAILVKTGRGEAQLMLPESSSIDEFHIAGSLLDAVPLIHNLYDLR
ncbi:MAG: HAD-IIIA family hydrolase [Chloroflexi bacterium]|jgi:D-glycero-D-manno-heptose 1,7-bisphosphate phosphatase|nr:HAD-IIIA family hydrolase [Anaerolineaceae bacterium]NMB89828.1 HAD-IIIA family hydrolase [Chloroflexota bacterium]